MRLFPYVLLRIAGEPLEKIRRLDVDESLRLVETIDQLQEMMSPLQAELSDLLYEQIARSTKQERRELIRLRRDIFNGRPVQDRDGAWKVGLPPHIEEKVAAFGDLQAEAVRLHQRGVAVFAEELAMARARCRQLVQGEPLQKGLLLSSQSLFKYGLPHYLKQDPASFNKKALKTEQSLVKYLSRICAKTSPFSTFTNLAVGVLSDEDGALRVQPAVDRKVQSHIRLNNFLYRYLRELLLKNPDVYRHFPLRPNPTITEEKSHYLFLTNSHNIEAFQRLPLNPVLALIQQLCARKREGVPYRDVVHAMIEGEHVDAPVDVIEQYINQLIAYGFLEFNPGVSGIDPDWDLKLKAQLAVFCPDNRLMDELCRVLDELRTLSGRYAAADVAGRQPLLAEAFERFKAICLTLHEAAGLPEAERQAAGGRSKFPPAADDASEEEDLSGFTHQSHTAFYFRPEQMFFEDTALVGPCRMPDRELEELVCLLHELQGAFADFAGLRDEREKMAHFFEQQFGADTAISLLTFYEEYYRQIKKPEMEKVLQQGQKGEEDALPEKEQGLLPATAKRQAHNQAWLERIGKRVVESNTATDEQIDVSRHHVFEGSLGGHDRGRNAYGAFVQLFYQPHMPQLMGVVNSTFPGFGKMTSRLLHLFDQKVTATTRAWNEALSHEDLLLENADASYFNANLHPPLLPFEVWMPGGHNSLPPEQQIAVTELDVYLDPLEQRLCLRHQPSQQRAYVLDLGFQGRRGRSELFNLLDHFTLAEYVAPWPLIGAINRQLEHGQDNQIQVKPRIVYEQRLILQRKAWLIPKAQLPIRKVEESDWAYFARLQTWRLALDIPDEIFVVLFERSQIEELAPDARARLGRDDYKPQYISFRNPFLVSLFEKLLTKVPERLKIEEMLPCSEQLLPIAPQGQDRFVTEFVVQWYEGGNRERR